MTRINVLEPHQLPTKLLLAEYHELPRCIKQKMDIGDEADRPYHLGKGHMKWGKAHSSYLMNRYSVICDVLRNRGVHINYPWQMLLAYCIENGIRNNPMYWNDYNPTLNDLYINLERIKQNETDND